MAPRSIPGRRATVRGVERRRTPVLRRVVVGVTTTERDGAVELGPDEWAEGGAPERSWASPWFVLTVKHANVRDRLGRLTGEATDRIANEHARLVGVDVV